MKISAAIFAILAIFATAGCQSTASVNAAIQENISEFCDGAEQTHAVYLIAEGSIPKQYQAQVDAAYATIERLCATPEKVTITRITAALAAHLIAIKNANDARAE